MAAIAPALFPEMKKRGAKEGELVALLAATGAQTETVPPSLVLITIGSVTGVSIAALFTGGLLPALVLGLVLCVVVWFRYRHEDLRHVKRAPMERGGATGCHRASGAGLALCHSRRGGRRRRHGDRGVHARHCVRRHRRTARSIASSTGSASGPMLVATASLSGAILLIIGTATAMAWGLTQSGFSRALAEMMAALPGGVPMFLAVSVVAFVVLGSVLEGIPAVVLFGPLLFPIARQLGVHEVHYAMVVVLSMGLGLFAPPMGVGYYAACAIARVHPDKGIRPIVGYMVALADRDDRRHRRAMDFDRLSLNRVQVLLFNYARVRARAPQVHLWRISCHNVPVIVGWSHSPFGKLDVPDVEGLITSVARSALDHAGVAPEDVDFATVGVFNNGLTPQGFEGGLVSLGEPALRFTPAMHVENACATGTAALHTAHGFHRKRPRTHRAR